MPIVLRVIAGLALISALEVLEFSVSWRVCVDLAKDLVPGARSDGILAALLRRRMELGVLPLARLGHVALVAGLLRVGGVRAREVGPLAVVAGLAPEMAQAATDLAVAWAHGPAFTAQFVPEFPPAYAWSGERFVPGWFVPATRALVGAVVLREIPGSPRKKIAAAAWATAAITGYEAGYAAWFRVY